MGTRSNKPGLSKLALLKEECIRNRQAAANYVA